MLFLCYFQLNISICSEFLFLSVHFVNSSVKVRVKYSLVLCKGIVNRNFLSDNFKFRNAITCFLGGPHLIPVMKSTFMGLVFSLPPKKQTEIRLD